MFEFIKNKSKKKDQNTDLILKTASLLIHAAKIDENYTSKEKSIIVLLISELTKLNLGFSISVVLALIHCELNENVMKNNDVIKYCSILCYAHYTIL